MPAYRRAILYGASSFLLVTPLALWILLTLPNTPIAIIAPVTQRLRTADAAPARIDPLELIQRARDQFRRVGDYRAVLLKQELLDDELTAVQQVEVRVRREPYSIYMLWRENEANVRRALFVEDPAFVDKQGRKLARVEPAGEVVRLFVRDIKLPIDGAEARSSSRRTIDECGFGPAFRLLEQINARAAQRGDLDLRYEGVGEVDGRPTHVLVRYLPYTGPGGGYPDAKLVIHIDQERLLPTALYSYADREGTKLLGSYVYTQVELDPKFTASDFEF